MDLPVEGSSGQIFAFQSWWLLHISHNHIITSMLLHRFGSFLLEGPAPDPQKHPHRVR